MYEYVPRDLKLLYKQINRNDNKLNTYHIQENNDNKLSTKYMQQKKQLC